ncbi:hypothetical protein TNCV_141821 [Trichonephila clavipes]|nr:hypothetical protein TNCV_141821 [Trichonephila clavipes]
MARHKQYQCRRGRHLSCRQPLQTTTPCQRKDFELYSFYSMGLQWHQNSNPRPSSHEFGIIYKVSPNVMYKLGGEVENIVRSHNYIRKHGRKELGGAVRELARSVHMVSSIQQGRL